MELVVTKVKRRVDGLERLEVDIDLTFLSFGRNDFTTVDDQTIRRNFVVQLQTLLCRSDGGENRKPIDTGFDVGGSALWTDPGKRRSDGSSVVANIQILQPTSLLLEKPDPWALSKDYISYILLPALDGKESLRMMREIMEVPFPLAASSRLISFLTFQISMFFSASFG